VQKLLFVQRNLQFFLDKTPFVNIIYEKDLMGIIVFKAIWFFQITSMFACSQRNPYLSYRIEQRERKINGRKMDTG
jgi:hypothetical protein